MTILTTIHDWIVSVTGFDPDNVIRGFQTGPRPDDDYATYYILSVVDHDYSSYQKRDLGVDDNIEVLYSSPKELLVTVDIYALNGHALMSALGQSNDLLATRLLFNAEQLVLLPGGGNASSLTGLGDTEWRDRYNGTFTIGAYGELTEENQKILSVYLEGDLGGLESVIETGG